MDLEKPIRDFMVSTVITVEPEDSMEKVDRIFKENSFHHIPVVENGSVVGIIGKPDFLYFLRGNSSSENDRFIREARLRAFRVEEIMTRDVIIAQAKDSTRSVLELLLQRRFRAVPIQEEGKLVGIITTFDFLRHLANS